MPRPWDREPEQMPRGCPGGWAQVESTDAQFWNFTVSFKSTSSVALSAFVVKGSPLKQFQSYKNEKKRQICFSSMQFAFIFILFPGKKMKKGKIFLGNLTS